MHRIEINDAEVTSALGRLAAGMEDMTPAMQEIVEFMIASTKDRFPTGQAPDGTPWAPKSQTTLDAYAARGDRVDARPLFGPSGMLSSQIFGIATADSAEWGSPMIYAAVMQLGAGQGQFGAQAGRTRPSEKRPKSKDYFFHIPWGDIPARPFLGLSDADRQGIVDIVGEYLDGLAQPG